MARFVRRHNPDLFGEDIVDLGWTAVGLAVSGWANDRIVAPLSRRVVTTLPAPDSFVGKMVDAVTTAISAFLAGTVVGVVDRRVGRFFLRGGLMLGVAKVISAFIPGFGLSAQVPLPSFQLPQVPPPAQQPPAPVGGTASAAFSPSFPNSSAVGL